MVQPSDDVPRTPPKHVTDALTREVGFGCPARGCGNPYLSWHHFDPPWRVEHHHRLEGMIALCVEHAARADGGAYTDDQLRELKKVGEANTESVQGRFDWLRQSLVFSSGNIWFLETPNLILHNRKPIIWWRRVDGLVRVSLDIPGPQGPRLQMADNVWTNLLGAATVRCPPQGRSLSVRYPDGDMLELKFSNIESEPRAHELFAAVPAEVNFPTTVLEIRLRIEHLRIDLRPKGDSKVAGYTNRGCMLVEGCVNGILL